MQIINQAYSVLSDPAARAKYDVKLADEEIAASNGAQAEKQQEQRRKGDDTERERQGTEATRRQREPLAAERKRPADEAAQQRQAAEEANLKRQPSRRGGTKRSLRGWRITSSLLSSLASSCREFS
jgi:curved DNA-binding protein CbpA